MKLFCAQTIFKKENERLYAHTMRNGEEGTHVFPSAEERGSLPRPRVPYGACQPALESFTGPIKSERLAHYGGPYHSQLLSVDSTTTIQFCRQT